MLVHSNTVKITVMGDSREIFLYLKMTALLDIAPFSLVEVASIIRT